MLSEVIGPVELLGAITLAKLVVVLQMTHALVPVLFSDMPHVTRRGQTRSSKLLTAVSAGVGFTRPCGGFVECPVVGCEC